MPRYRRPPGGPFSDTPPHAGEVPQPALGLPLAGPRVPPADPPDHLGHRQRLRDRFLAGGADALADYELLELLLFQAIPRRDTKPLARTLLKRFGGFAGVVAASPADLRGVDGVGEAVVAALKTVEACAVRLVREQAFERPVMSSWDRVIDYCRAGMAHGGVEQFRVLYLDARNAVIEDRVEQRGTVNHTPAYPREVVKRALELGATAIILVHNHPSGDPSPSQADIDMTRTIADAAGKLGIRLHDHVIVGRSGHASLKGLGLF